MKSSEIVSKIQSSARWSVHACIGPSVVSALAAVEITFRKKSNYRVVLTLHPLSEIAVEANGQDAVTENASFPLALEVTDIQEEKRFHSKPVYQFQRPDFHSETSRARPQRKWPSTCITQEIYGIEKVAEELTSQAHAQAIRVSDSLNPEGHGNEKSEGIANARQ